MKHSPKDLSVVSKVEKLIDPLQVSAYKMKMIYENRKSDSKPTVSTGVADNMYKRVKQYSLAPNIFS